MYGCKNLVLARQNSVLNAFVLFLSLFATELSVLACENASQFVRYDMKRKRYFRIFFFTGFSTLAEMKIKVCIPNCRLTTYCLYY